MGSISCHTASADCTPAAQASMDSPIFSARRHWPSLRSNFKAWTSSWLGNRHANMVHLTMWSQVTVTRSTMLLEQGTWVKPFRCGMPPAPHMPQMALCSTPGCTSPLERHVPTERLTQGKHMSLTNYADMKLHFGWQDAVNHPSSKRANA